MIRFNLKKLLTKLEKETGRKYLLKEVAELSGCDKNALSRMVNHPEIVPSAAVIDKLVQFFFYAMKEKTDKQYASLKLNTKWIMETIIRDFIVVYPDRADFWEILPKEIRDNSDSVTLDTVWSIYERLSNPRIDTPVTEIRPSTLLDAMEPIQIEEDGQRTIRFTLPEEHYLFIMRKLPEIIEILFPESLSDKEVPTPKDNPPRAKQKSKK